jgi:hypothetical protein
VNGNTPLHVAVQEGYADLVQLLISASPPLVLHIENGVGDVPLSIAHQQALLWLTRTKLAQDLPDFLILQHNSISMSPRRFKPTTGTEIENLEHTLKVLLSDGRLKQNTKLTTALFTFLQTLEAKLHAARRMPSETISKDEKDPKDEVNRTLTLQHVRTATSKSSGIRQLVHVLDVHRSVRSDLPVQDENTMSTHSFRRNNDGLGLEAEEAGDQAQSLVFSVITIQGKRW